MSRAVQLDKWFPGRRARAVIGGALALVIALCVALGYELTWRYDWAQGRLQEIEPRYARLEGLLGQEPRLLETANQLNERLAQVAYPGDMPVERVGTDLQQRVRQIADRNGLVTRQSQILALREGQVIDQVPLSLLLEGDSDALLIFLLDLQREALAVHVNSTVIQGGGRGANAHKLRIQLELSAYRQRGGGA